LIAGQATHNNRKPQRSAPKRLQSTACNGGGGGGGGGSGGGGGGGGGRQRWHSGAFGLASMPALPVRTRKHSPVVPPAQHARVRAGVGGEPRVRLAVVVVPVVAARTHTTSGTAHLRSFAASRRVIWLLLLCIPTVAIIHPRIRRWTLGRRAAGGESSSVLPRCVRSHRVHARRGNKANKRTRITGQNTVPHKQHHQQRQRRRRQQQ
jgi:hypothetical protein